MSATPFEWSVMQWFNIEAPIFLEQLKGRVVVVGAFQMLCPSCVALSLPQLKKLHEMSRAVPLTVIGLHTVFEHHLAMQPHVLQAFIHEYALQFPIGVDTPDNRNPIPKTMAAWQLRGTPSTLVFAPDGELCLHQFGHLDDMALGLLIGQLLGAATPLARTHEDVSGSSRTD